MTDVSLMVNRSSSAQTWRHCNNNGILLFMWCVPRRCGSAMVIFLESTHRQRNGRCRRRRTKFVGKRQTKQKFNFKSNKFERTITSAENTFNKPLNYRNFYTRSQTKIVLCAQRAIRFIAAFTALALSLHFHTFSTLVDEICLLSLLDYFLVPFAFPIYTYINSFRICEHLPRFICF